MRLFASLEENDIGDGGAKAIAEALAVNQSLTSLRYKPLPYTRSPLLSAAADKPLTVTPWPCFLADVLAFVCTSLAAFACASLAACVPTRSVLRVRRQSERLWQPTRALPPSSMLLPYQRSPFTRLYCQQPLTPYDSLLRCLPLCALAWQDGWQQYRC